VDKFVPVIVPLHTKSPACKVSVTNRLSLIKVSPPMMVEPVTVIEDTFKAEGIKASLEALITLFTIVTFVPAVRVGWTFGAVIAVADIWIHDRLHTFNLDTFNRSIVPDKVKAEAFKELVLNTTGENIVVLRLLTVILTTEALVADRLSLLVPILILFPDCPLKLT
jgi:hypothetical protein